MDGLSGDHLRKVLEFVALTALLMLWAITAYALLGPHPLQGRIPTHFDIAGNPNAWGAPYTLWLLPIVGTVLYGLMTLVSRYPGGFNYPVHVTPSNRDGLQWVALRMIAWLKAEVLWLFVWIQMSTINAAKENRDTLPQLTIIIALVIVFGTIGWHILEMRRVADMNLRRGRF